jgi:hypothetical protein
MPYVNTRSHHVVLSGRAPMVDVSLSTPPRSASRYSRERIEAASPRPRITLIYTVSAVFNWLGAMRGTSDDIEGVPIYICSILTPTLLPWLAVHEMRDIEMITTFTVSVC